ncbi:MAG: hypothetical protein ABGY71_02385 [bacterium]|jgi:hypothetical protein|nr:hypothetical protein [Planctomycetota bacterium]HIL52226.1 hypothetical protein [Planctomycetota bacterium]
MTAFESIQISSFCRHLCSKKLVIQRRAPLLDEDLLDASCHTWCEKTQESIGPDCEPTCVDDCRAPRACFVPYSGA